MNGLLIDYYILSFIIYLYTHLRIHDSDQSVRQTCLLVLTHLILNDMIKVKGCVADIARCTLDDRPEMAGLAKLFFSEMAAKV